MLLNKTEIINILFNLMENSYINDFNTIVKTYHKELSKCKTISKEEEKKLLIEAKNNNLVAKNKIITSNLRFVFNIAKSYKGYGVAMEDLISEGNLGLTKAIDKFDLSQDVKFISYAVWWIRHSIKDFIQKRQKIDSIEFSESDEFNKSIYENGLNDEYDDKVIKSEVIYSDENDTINNEMDNNRKEVISALLKKLSPNGQFIIKHYYGIGLKKSLNINEIAEILNISSQRVHKIKEKQLRILRSELLMDDDLIKLLYKK